MELTLDGSPTLKGRKRWFGVSSGFAGVVTIDAQARTILEGGGASLLPVGVIKVEGEFEVGDVISIVDTRGIEVGRGLAGQMATSLKRVAGLRSAEARKVLDDREKDEVVHRDNLVVFTEPSDVA